jgi:cell division protein FtsA
VAENLKLNFGYAVARDVGSKETIELKKLHPEAEGMVSRRFVAEIIESRLAEIFDLVNTELKLWGKAGQLPGGVVLVGGGAKMPGLSELAKSRLKLSSQIGLALTNEWEAAGGNFSELLEDPEYVGVLGLVLWGIDESGWAKASAARFDVKNFFKYFLP